MMGNKESKYISLINARSSRSYIGVYDKEKVVLIPKLNDKLISGFKITFEHEVIDVSMAEKIRKMTEMLNGEGEGKWN